MIINDGNLQTLFRGFSSAFSKGFGSATNRHKTVSMEIPSQTKEEEYGWLGQFPRMREWLGDRIVENLSVHSYALVNKDFEITISIPRSKIEDDQYGMFGPIFTEMGKNTAEHPEEIVFSTMAQGFSTTCYDGQYFFDADHPVRDEEGNTVSQSNTQEGTNPAWFLLDCSRQIKPMIFQRRQDYQFVRLDREQDGNVFWRNEYIYGVYARLNADFGLWQLAFASKAELSSENYEAARQTMMSRRGDEGRPLNILPDTLVVPPSLEGAAMRLLNNGTRVDVADNGSGTMTPVAITNEWAGSANLIVTPWLAA